VRDVVFQALANSLLVMSAIYGTVNIGIAFGYLAFYVLYVLVVLFLDKLQRRRARLMSGGAVDEEDEGASGATVMSAFWFTPSDIAEFSVAHRDPRVEQAGLLTHDFLLLEEVPTDGEEDGQQRSPQRDHESSRPNFKASIISEYFSNPDEDVIDGSSLLVRPLSASTSQGTQSASKISPFNTTKGGNDSVDFVFSESEDEGAGASVSERQAARSITRARKPLHQSLWHNMYWQHWRLRRKLLREIRASEWGSKSIWGKVFSLIESPLIFARNLTIPTVEEESWSRLMAVCYPIFSPIFFLGIADALQVNVGACPLWVLVELGGVGVSIFIFLTTHESRPPTSFLYSMAFISLAFIMCAAWIYSIASELVSVIEALGDMWGIPSSLLGLTLLAWGNSVGDLITNIAVARSGLSDMAIAGCFAGPTFNLLVGMGLSFLWKCINSPGGSFRMELDARSHISLAFLYIALGANLVIAYSTHFKLGKAVAIGLVGIYGTYTLVQIIMIITKPGGKHE